jgi:primosomal protein N'
MPLIYGVLYMSIKDNVDFIKDELSAEEKFFENFFKLENIWKKYKKAIVAVGVVAVISFVGSSIYNYVQTQNKIEANNAYSVLQENPSDTKAKETLKQIDQNLYALSQYVQNNKNKTYSDIDAQFLDKIAKYNIAIEKGDQKTIDQLILDDKFLLNDYATFQKALLQAINKDYKGAKKTIALIPENSAVSQLSNQLKHFLLTK